MLTISQAHDREIGPDSLSSSKRENYSFRIELEGFRSAHIRVYGTREIGGCSCCGNEDHYPRRCEPESRRDTQKSFNISHGYGEERQSDREMKSENEVRDPVRELDKRPAFVMTYDCGLELNSLYSLRMGNSSLRVEYASLVRT